MRINFLIKALSFAAIASGVSVADSYELNIQVLGADNKPVSEAVVYVTADSQAFSQAALSQPHMQPTIQPPANLVKMAVMDQRNKTFAPHVLAVPVGTKVDFPNTDSVNHYVYSFSEIKKFQFKLFKGDPEKHQTVFDKPGVVAIGCNIHDFMLAYIFVAPSPYVAVTDAAGEAHLVLPDKSEFTFGVWYERSNEDLTKITQKVSFNPAINNKPVDNNKAAVSNKTEENIKIHFTKPFKPQRKMSHDNDY